MKKTGLDFAPFQKEMSRVFAEYRALNGRALPYLLRNRAIQLSIGSGKGGQHKGLYQEALSLRPKVQAEIKALPRKLKWHIKRSPGRTVEKEITYRQLQAGRFQASGWIVPGLQDITGEGAKVKTIRGKVSFTNTASSCSVTLTNTSPRAFEFGMRTGYIAKAFYNQTQDMLIYIRKHLGLTVEEFRKKHPNFKRPISAFIPK